MTTDNQTELFDVVDEQDQVIGKATRGEVHKNKRLIHRSIYVAVFNARDDLFIQQRSETKDKDPLFWDISVGGHVLCEDTYEESAKRELFEELGVVIPITFVAKYLALLPTETEMVTLYTAKSDGPFILHPLEIQQGRFFSKDTLLSQIGKNAIQLSVSPQLGLKRLGWL